MNAPPPVAKFKFTLTITGNTLTEIEDELVAQTRGGFLLDSDCYLRHEWEVVGGRRTSCMEHTNPDMTPERYDAELRAWFDARKAHKRRQEADRG